MLGSFSVNMKALWEMHMENLSPFQKGTERGVGRRGPMASTALHPMSVLLEEVGHRGNDTILSYHALNDRRTPSLWTRHEFIWTDAHCDLLAGTASSSLEDCMATCLSEERCTAFNYAPAKERRGCERRHCAHGEQPTLLRHGWVGYSKYSSRDAKLKHPEDITMLPSILTAALLLLVAITSVLVALQRACPDRVDDLLARLTKRPRSDSPPPMHHSSRGHGQLWTSASWIERLMTPWELHARRNPVELQMLAAATSAHRKMELDEDESWNPVHTDPLTCNSQHFSSSRG